jgi:hypothetical protein
MVLTIMTTPMRCRRRRVCGGSRSFITGAERRRKWSVEEKAEIVVESLVEGADVSDVARTASVRSSCSAGVQWPAPSPPTDFSSLMHRSG